MGNPMGGGGGKGGPEKMFGGGGSGDMDTPLGTMNIGQWLGLSKGNKPQSVGSATGDVVGALTKHLPGYNQMLRNEARPNAKMENRLRSIMQEGEKRRLKNQGRKEVRITSNISRATDPEYYANRETVARNLQELMKPGLTGGEIESIRRGQRTDMVGRGTDNVDSNMNTIANATTFGRAARDRMQSATGLAGSLQPMFQSISPESIFSIGSGRDVMTPGTSQSEKFGENIFGTKLAEMNLLGQREGQYHGGLGKLVGSVCGCYIFRAHYGIDIPWWVVFARDYFHSLDPMLGHGYKRMANWLVPLMKRWTIVRKLVEHTMIWPLTKYGGYMYGVEGYESGWKYKPIVKFWFNIWRKG